VSCWHALTQVYRLDLASKKIAQITKGVQDYAFVAEANDKLIGMKHSMSKPDEIYTINPKTGVETELSFLNKPILDQLTLAKVEERWIKTTDNKQMQTWVIYPPHFDPNKKYPTLLFCEGGPQSTVSQFWSYRWNFQQMAANGYIVVAPNRRGLPGFGQEWLEQISGDYGGQNMKDYLSAIDEVAKEPFVDKDKLGCVGASYGGFSVYWLAGHHEKRFKAFIAHDGMFNLEQQYLETEEMWFVNWDLGGPYWDKTNAVAQRSYANSPHLFVDKWDSPILVIHGEKDYRILASQGMAAFNAAVLRGVPAQMLIFPDENHWVLQPQNGILWQRVFKQWLDKWLK
jgi:dipeptidyl aminopeptidase/acylaminoacyl peptidase